MLDSKHVDPIKDELALIKPMTAAFYPEYVKRLHGAHVKTGPNKADIVEQLRADIRGFIKSSGADRAVCVWCGSTEIYLEQSEAHQSIKAFEKGLLENDPNIPNSMLYAWACLKEGVPYANGAPNLTVDIPAMLELARETQTPVCGKDFKTGQTFMKTLLAPGLKARMLGMKGWFSTNILGNRDGEVLDEPGSFKSKEVSKLGAIEQILQPELYPELYGDIYHKVRIEYYPPRGDAKEGWDNIDIFGWLNYPMQIKIDFFVPRFDLGGAAGARLGAVQRSWVSAPVSGACKSGSASTRKSPQTASGLYPEHDLFIQSMKLKNTLRWMMGEDLITHLGNEYYD